jgi:hypothetical protein
VDVIVDDHLLLQILLNEEPPDFSIPGARIFTTGLWYHRLCRAVSLHEVTGAMSRRLSRADPVVAAGSSASPRRTRILNFSTRSRHAARPHGSSVIDDLPSVAHRGRDLLLAFS